jgi:hypothetical protein
VSDWTRSWAFLLLLTLGLFIGLLGLFFFPLLALKGDQIGHVD